MADGTERHAGVTMGDKGNMLGRLSPHRCCSRVTLADERHPGVDVALPPDLLGMDNPFVGSEAVASGTLLKSALRTRYTRVFRDVYALPGTEMTPQMRATAAWLWSRRKGIVAGTAASAVHGNRWFTPSDPVELIHSNRNPNAGLVIRSGAIQPDEIVLVAGVPVTSVERTALDLACWNPRDAAVASIDALANATKLHVPKVLALADRYPGRRGIATARSSLRLVDGGAQSPRETWLRLLLIDDGIPAPETQIPVPIPWSDKYIYLDMGWDEIKVAAEYDGDQHLKSPSQIRWDIKRHEIAQQRGYIVVRVLAGDTPADVLRRVRAAFARRGVTLA